MDYIKFYELPVWVAARRLQRIVYRLTQRGTFRSDWDLRSQVNSATGSILANIAEGFSRRYDKERVQFLFTAKSSLSEVQSHLFVSLDRAHVRTEDFSTAFEVTEEVAKQLSGFTSYLSDRKKRRVQEAPGTSGR